MQKLLAYPLSVIYLICFGLILLIFHPIQWACLTLFGYKAHKRSVSFLNLSLLRSTHLIGTYYLFKNDFDLPKDRPIIFVSNHQSMYDIPPLVWYFRAHHPKFVSKIELGKGIPSVSFNLRHGGSVLIDRKDSKQALREISKLGTYIETHKRSAVIFPEGTRSKTGRPKKFQPTGLKILMKKSPSALIVPISINGSWKMLRYGKFPNGLGSKFTITVHQPIENEGNSDDLIAQTQEKVFSGITDFT